MNQMNVWPHDRLIHGYWVIPGRLLATEYPGAKDPEKARRKLGVLRDAGVNSFVDLTESGEPTLDGTPMAPYDALLDSGITYRRFAIPDNSVIDDPGYDRILAHIRGQLESGNVVVAHCWGGKGRTGTVVGAWLIAEESLGYPDVLHRLQELRAGTRKADYPVPETEAQREVLRRRAQATVA